MSVMKNIRFGDTGSIASTDAPTVGSSLVGENVGTSPLATSTTKALLLSISVPRIYRVYIPPTEEPDPKRQSERCDYDGDVHPLLTADEKKGDVETRSIKSSSTKPQPVFQAGDESPLSSNEPIADYDDTTAFAIKSLLVGSMAETKKEQGDAEDDDGSELRAHMDDEYDSFFVEHGGESAGRRASVTAEEMDMIIRLANTDDQEEQQRMSLVPEGDNASVKTDPGMMTAASDAIMNFFGVIHKNNENSSMAYLSREEAVAAIKRYEPISRMLSRRAIEMDGGDEGGSTVKPKILKPNTEIKLEELLRLTFRNLYAENHFYNTPTYTDVQTRILAQAEMDDWIELSVMAKQASIGIVLERLERIGVGSRVGTIAIYKAELLRTCDILNENAAQEDPTKNSSIAGDGGLRLNSDGDPASAAAQKAAKMETARAEWKNATSRLRVEQVKEQIQEQAELGLDYISLLIIASILAGIGLVTDNAVIIVASMLVSPIMGPVMGMTFGTQVSDRKMALRGCWQELVSLLVSIAVGGIIGFSTAFCPVADSFPVEQMSSRGSLRGLMAGIAIAIPSGMGVALSILGNNTASLVGVAISASLLPPAVNAGICWAFAILIHFGAVDLPLTEDENGDPWDFSSLAFISFLLTMVNIICIWGGGLVMFEIKEVAPSRSKSAFWSRDIKIARAIQKGSRGPVNLDIIKATIQDVIMKERQAKGEQANDDEGPKTPVSSVTSTKKSKHPKKRNNQGYNFNISAIPAVDEANPIVDIGPAEDGRFYSFHDIARFLGLGQDSDDEEDEPPPPQVRRRFAARQPKEEH